MLEVGKVQKLSPPLFLCKRFVKRAQQLKKAPDGRRSFLQIRLDRLRLRVKRPLRVPDGL